MTLDFNKPIQTRDGRSVRIICTDKKGDFPIVVLITNPSGKEEVCTYTEDGYYYENEAQCDSDLVNAPEQKHMWINIYPDNRNEHYSYETLHEADVMANHYDRIGVIHIIIEDKKIVKIEQVWHD